MYRQVRELKCSLAIIASLTTPVAFPITAMAQSATVGAWSTVSMAGMGLPGTDFPDGHIPFLWDSTKNTYQMYWAEWESYRTTGRTPTTQTGAVRILGDRPFDRANPSYFDNSGSWLMSAFKVDPGTFTMNSASTYLIGFYHAEDHYFSGSYQDPIAWNGVGLATSYDNGLSWTKQGMILGGPDLKPGTATWGGIGNQCTILDNRSTPSVPRWITFYPTITSDGNTQGWGITAAASTDVSAARTSWKQWYNGSFSTTQYDHQGQNSSLPGLDVAASSNGGNISVCWNTYLKRWVMIFRTWDSQTLKIAYSQGTNPTQWTEPVTVVTAPSGATINYPTIIGTNASGKLSDVECGRSATIYYAYFPAAGGRQFVKQSVTFTP